MLIDTHCHLDAAEFDADRDVVLARATQLGVGRILIPGVERANFAAVASLCRAESMCRPAYGIHPMFVDRAREEDVLALADWLKGDEVVAVGEIGLDHFIEPRDEDRQLAFFRAQLELARKYELPVILHVRRAIDPILRELRRCRVVGGIAHAFNGSEQQAQAFIKLGFALGFGGAMTWSRAAHLRRLATSLPEEALVLETDAPDIPPEWVGRGRNEPGELRRIAEVLAQLRGCTPATVIDFTTRNAKRVLPRLFAPSTGRLAAGPQV